MYSAQHAHSGPSQESYKHDGIVHASNSYAAQRVHRRDPTPNMVHMLLHTHATMYTANTDSSTAKERMAGTHLGYHLQDLEEVLCIGVQVTNSHDAAVTHLQVHGSR
jgi:hypothetical protein